MFRTQRSFLLLFFRISGEVDLPIGRDISAGPPLQTIDPTDSGRTAVTTWRQSHRYKYTTDVQADEDIGGDKDGGGDGPHPSLQLRSRLDFRTITAIDSSVVSNVFSDTDPSITAEKLCFTKLDLFPHTGR